MPGKQDTKIHPYRSPLKESEPVREPVWMRLAFLVLLLTPLPLTGTGIYLETRWSVHNHLLGVCSITWLMFLFMPAILLLGTSSNDPWSGWSWRKRAVAVAWWPFAVAWGLIYLVWKAAKSIASWVMHGESD